MYRAFITLTLNFFLNVLLFRVHQACDHVHDDCSNNDSRDYKYIEHGEMVFNVLPLSSAEKVLRKLYPKDIVQGGPIQIMIK